TGIDYRFVAGKTYTTKHILPLHLFHLFAGNIFDIKKKRKDSTRVLILCHGMKYLIISGKMRQAVKSIT
ncbi:hypothetical protein ACJX0J_017916, partial [Zea mays]